MTTRQLLKIKVGGVYKTRNGYWTVKIIKHDDLAPLFPWQGEVDGSVYLWHHDGAAVGYAESDYDLVEEVTVHKKPVLDGRDRRTGCGLGVF